MNLIAFVLAARLLWSPNQELDFSHYIVYSGWQSGTYDAYQTTVDTSFAPLENGRFYAVRAVDHSGNVSGFSEVIQFKAQGDTMIINDYDTLTIQLIFTAGILPTELEFNKLQVEHRWKTATFLGEWKPLIRENKDYSLAYLNHNQAYFVDINLERLKSFLDRSVDWELEIRMKFPDDENFVENDTVLHLQLLQKARLLKFIIIER